LQLWPLVHAPQLVCVSAGQSLSVRQPVQVPSASLHTVAPTQGAPACTVHAPSSHESRPLQKMPSSQLAVLCVCVHTPSTHASSVQGFSSSQSPQTGPASLTPASGAPPSPG